MYLECEPISVKLDGEDSGNALIVFDSEGFVLDVEFLEDTEE